MTDKVVNEFAEQLKQLDSEQFHEGEPYKLDEEGKILKGAEMDAEGNDDVQPEADERVNENEPESGVQDDDEPDEEEDDPDEEEDDPDEEEDAEDEEGGKRLSKSAQLTRALRQTRRITADLKREIAELKAETKAPKNADGTPMSAKEWAVAQLQNDEKAPKEPNPLARDKDGKLVFPLGQFDRGFQEAYLDYRDARKEYVEAKIGEFQKGVTSAPVSAAPEPSRDELMKAVEAFTTDDKGVPGFKEAVAAARKQEWPLSETVVRLALESPVGREITVHFHQNPKLAEEIAGLPEYQQAARVGKLEAQMLAEQKANKRKPKLVSDAPKPLAVKPRGGGGTAPPSYASTDFDVVERKWKQAQRAQQR